MRMREEEMNSWAQRALMAEEGLEEANRRLRVDSRLQERIDILERRLKKLCKMMGRLLCE